MRGAKPQKCAERELWVFSTKKSFLLFLTHFLENEKLKELWRSCTRIINRLRFQWRSTISLMFDLLIKRFDPLCTWESSNQWKIIELSTRAAYQLACNECCRSNPKFGDNSHCWAGYKYSWRIILSTTVFYIRKPIREKSKSWITPGEKEFKSGSSFVGQVRL